MEPHIHQLRLGATTGPRPAPRPRNADYATRLIGYIRDARNPAVADPTSQRHSG
ncbi:MAG TPA: hypothetical protein VHY21_24980 [Pseudonocardiaceae bacterium]|nr:hypothetical protein [Pseudonocardiaceae bacterium]